MKRLAVLISGYGSNLQAIIDAIESGQLEGAQIAIVVSDRAKAYGLKRAQTHGIPAVHFAYPPSSHGREGRLKADAELAALLKTYQVDWVVLAGWLRVLSNQFLRHFPMRVLNLHPALPGQFPGLEAIERAFRAYHAGEIEETGAMVHLVPDEAVDAGPALISEAVRIDPEDTLQSLTARVHAIEHRILIQALRQVLSE